MSTQFKGRSSFADGLEINGQVDATAPLFAGPCERNDLFVA